MELEKFDIDKAKAGRKVVEKSEPKTMDQQYNDYLNWGGTMTKDEWYLDGRYDMSLEPSYNDYV